MKTIQLNHGKAAIVDDDLYDELSSYRWKYRRHRTRPEKDGYVYCYSSSRTVYMHRFVMEEPAGRVDHRNGDPLDNRRSNLRLASQTQNLGNAALSTRNKSGYKGVSLEKRTQKWRATIRFKHKHYELGLFDDPLEAARRYDQAALELFGEFARTNRSNG